MDYAIQIFVTAMGVVMSFGYYPQAWRIFRNKSAENISLSTFAIFAVGTTTWFLYGLYESNWVIILSFVFGMVGSWLVLGLSYRYRTSHSTVHPQN